MKRRDFIKKTGLAAAGFFAAPTLLPSGRLFAATGSRRVKHVVFCLYAGGIRNIESLQKKEGNLMPHLLNGTEKITSDILPGMDSVPAPVAPPLENLGTLYKEFRYNSRQTVHYNGHATSITGIYSPNVQIMKPLEYPTIFEYFRKYQSPNPSALNSWWISDQAGPFTYLNYSAYPGYGAKFGANMIQPTSFFSSNVLADVRKFEGPEIELAKKYSSFLDNKWNSGIRKKASNGVHNLPEHQILVQDFLQTMTKDIFAGKFSDPWNTGYMNDDMVTVYSAIKVLENFKPELLVVNMQDSDIGHANFTQYCNNMRKADFTVYKLWESIQSIPEMKDDTVLIIAPEFGRNLLPNTIVDEFGRKAIDHTGDNTSKEIFCLILGPEGVVNRGKKVNKISGESIDIAPTIAEILGFGNEIPTGMLPGRFLQEAFV